MNPYIIAAIAIVWLGSLVGAYEAGAVHIEKSDAKGATKQDVKVATQEGVSSEKVKEEGQTYAQNLSVPATGAPTLVMCPVLPSPARTVLQTRPSRPSPSEAPPVRAGDMQQSPETEWDSTPTVQVGKDADSQINGLLDYVRDVCKPK